MYIYNNIKKGKNQQKTQNKSKIFYGFVLLVQDTVLQTIPNYVNHKIM